MTKVRARFAPSPTGPLHIGGVRTALYCYLFCKQHDGTFILRIEDTDQNRKVDGAEEYIMESLNWFGLTPHEGPGIGGDFGPYRQSERKELYRQYAEKMIADGNAYYAFDTSEELTQMKADWEAKGVHSAKYNFMTRDSMKNSLNMSDEEVQSAIKAGHDVVVRLKIPQNEIVTVQDDVRGEVEFRTNELDDKVILKSDGMPTYHLANIVDDHLMEITHVIRGEEWLSSTAHHVLMYRFLNWETPSFAHLPLILKPSGKGKLSKRDGAKFGFPVFPIEWTDPETEEVYAGFREQGFLPAAVLNFLAFLGWNPGTEQEIFSVRELAEAFSVEKIVKSGARFDYDKARWFNQQYIMSESSETLAELINQDVVIDYPGVHDEYLRQVCHLMKERVHTMNEFVSEARYFFEPPTEYEEKMIRKKFKEENIHHFHALVRQLDELEFFHAAEIEKVIKTYVENNEIGFGAIFPILRIALSGSTKGPDLFSMIELLGKEETLNRIGGAMEPFTNIKNG